MRTGERGLEKYFCEEDEVFDVSPFATGELDPSDVEFLVKESIEEAEGQDTAAQEEVIEEKGRQGEVCRQGRAGARDEGVE